MGKKHKKNTDNDTTIENNPNTTKKDDATTPQENPLATLHDDTHALLEQGEKSLVKKKDTPLLKQNETQHDDSNNSSKENTTLSEQPDILNSSKEKAKEYAHEGMATLREFFALLLSFITALFPNLGDIFKWHILKKLFAMVRIEHTLFALPFAYVGLLIASKGSVHFIAFILITIAMFGIRSFAMAMNRIVDVHFDSLNPRTQKRELVTGEVTMGQAKAFAFISLCIFIVACACINTTLLALTPIPIIFSVLYSYMKRFTWYCHFILGAILGLAPIAGELAILGSITPEVVTLAFGILFWVAGFDILYSCQDADFDKEHSLYSIPACFGISTALLIAKLCHVNTILFFFLFGLFAGLNVIWYIVWLGIAGLLLWEHSMLSENDISKINHAFFTINACISIAVLIGVYFA